MSNSLLHDATLNLVNQSTKDFWLIIRADVSKQQPAVVELVNAGTAALMGSENPAVSRRLCRAVINLLTRDSVEVPRQQGSPELSEALERVINLLRPPSDTQWTQDEYQAVKQGLTPKEKPPIGLD